MKKTILFLILSITFCQLSKAQDDILESAFESAFDKKNVFDANLGLTSIDGQNYFGMRVQPEFSFGKIGLGLDVPLLFDVTSGKIRTEEFKHGAGVLRMIRFFRYGNKNTDNVYIKIGDLSGERLGFGSLVGNYTNATSFERRKVGASASFLFKKIVGLELIYSDLNFSGSTKMLGIRPFVKPFGKSNIPIIKTMEIGASFVTDNDDFQEKGAPTINTKYSADGVKASSFDLGVSLLRTQMINLTFDAQYSKLSKNNLLATDNPLVAYDAGTGFAIGVETDFRFIANTVLMNARIERQWYGDNYIPQLFNFAYEINKDARLQELLTAKKSQGIFGSLSAEILKIVKIGGSLLIPDDIDNSDPNSRRAILGIDLETKQIGRFKARGTYVKAGLNDLGDAFTLDERSLANLIVTYKIGRFMEAGVDYQWTFAADENGVFKATNQVRPYVGISLDF
ncbi:hypothetical protein OD91_0633 [Lutibacter sp. Hel_I_33_5]|uniref:hypothetical protein n=1 Tax=Lutibacter sp. Hel_I_33_5 TaxID=1566289 RepID=UPI0011A315C8|nr:hypothetical protein [Lutibacter sp. Hel_I_33_5]TVZ55386.1 hypothetical protein OD91_0633 [Lutibacter sp. Hel_I_33_5]